MLASTSFPLENEGFDIGPINTTIDVYVGLLVTRLPNGEERFDILSINAPVLIEVCKASFSGNSNDVVIRRDHWL